MRKFLSILGMCLLASACSGAGAGSSTSATPGASGSSGASGSTSAPSYRVDAGADRLTLRIAADGGFVAPGYILTRLPQFALYGDGRVIVGGPVIEIYPSPLLPNLRLLRVTPAEIQKILAAADNAGLLGSDASYDASGVMDAATTVFTTNVDGAAHTIRAYALSESSMTANAADAAERARLVQFSHAMSNLSTFLGRAVSDADAYAPTAMRVFVGQASATEPQGLTRQVVAWPLTTDPGTVGVPTSNPGLLCVALTGNDLEAFLAVAKTANALTVWTFGDGRYSVSVRPLYPDESGCAGPSPSASAPISS